MSGTWPFRLLLIFLEDLSCPVHAIPGCFLSFLVPGLARIHTLELCPDTCSLRLLFAPFIL